MEMRAREDVDIGEELTPPLPPLAFVLRDSAVGSHCSACFSSLSPQPPSQFYPKEGTPTPLYCSSRCSSLDSQAHAHLSSAESNLLSLFHQSQSSTWPDSAEIRLALRLLSRLGDYPPESGISIRKRKFQNSFISWENDLSSVRNEDSGALECRLPEKPLESVNNCHQEHLVRERIGGLMTNRENLLLEIEEENVAERVAEGLALIAKARNMKVNKDSNQTLQELELEEAILCLVLTNAVEVHDKSGCSLGIAVYDTTFSWINHSCSPNSCYRFLLGPYHDENAPLRITPAGNTASSDSFMCEYASKSRFSGNMSIDCYCGCSAA